MLKYFQIISYIYLVTCHNILRLPTVRQGRFELRHQNKVQSKDHYRELKVKTVEVCVDRCVADSQCKSVNFFSTGNDDAILDFCQLVAYDVTDNSNYVDRTGWNHYDTGRTKVTRIKNRYTGECYVPDSSSGCALSSSYIIPVPSSDSRCNSLEAYFEFDRDTGRITHYCSGKYVCGTSYSNNVYIKIQENCRKSYVNDLIKRWIIFFGENFY